MYLIQILLPLQNNEGNRFPRAEFDRVRQELTEAHGGVTAFLRSPAEGIWKDEGEINRDEIVMIEVMTETLDQQWWAQYRAKLEQRFEQEELVIRATGIELL